MNITLYDSDAAKNIATALSTNDAAPSPPALVERTVIATGGTWQPRGWDVDLRTSDAPAAAVGLHTARDEPAPSSRAWARIARVVVTGCRWQHNNWAAVRTSAQSMVLVAETSQRPTKALLDAVARTVGNWRALSGRSEPWTVPPGAGAPQVGEPLHILDARVDRGQHLAVLVTQVPELHQLRFTPHALPADPNAWRARHRGPDILYVANHPGGYVRFLLDTGDGQGFYGQPFDLHLVDGSSRVVVGPWSSGADVVAQYVPDTDIHTTDVVLHDNPEDFRTGRRGRVGHLTRTAVQHALTLATTHLQQAMPGRAVPLPERSAGRNTTTGAAGHRISPPQPPGPTRRVP